MKYLSDENSESSDQNKLLTQLGSFWLDFLEDREQARGLLAAASQTNLINKFQNGLQQLVSRNANYSEFITIHLDLLTVLKTQLTTTGEIAYLDEKDKERVVALYNSDIVPYDGNADGVTRYLIPKSTSKAYTVDHKGLMPIAQSFEIHSIDTVSGLLIRNIDFYQTDTHYVFYRDPRELFPNARIYVKSSSSDIQSIYRFPLRQKGVGRFDNSKFLSRCARFEQSLASFTLALSAVAGLNINKKTGVLKSTTEAPTKYILDDGRIVEADYTHKSLVENKAYQEEYIIGEGLEVYYAKNKYTKWWREVDWSSGFPLHAITKFNDLTIRDGTQIANYYTKIVDGENKVFVTWEIEGATEEVDDYWNLVESKQIEKGIYLADTLGIEAELVSGVDVYINPIDVLFETTIDCTAIVIVIDDKIINDPGLAIDYIEQEAPVGAVVIPIIRQSIESQSLITDAVFEVEGDFVSVAIESLEDGRGETKLSRDRAKRLAAWISLEKALDAGDLITGTVTGKVKG
ncbi:MAG: hypothetical protein EBY39_10605, partial [Flavobacteriia bacterium]|nr:hypothetical protein [Flavobacteriia bacterium]